MWFTILIVLFLFVLLCIVLLCIGLGFWFRCINPGSSKMIQEDLYTFHLRRVIVVRRYIPNLQAVKKCVSKHTIEMTTDDPFRMMESIRKSFPGWEIVNFQSRTDQEFDAMEGRR
jgi:hypothetical protein